MQLRRFDLAVGFAVGAVGLAVGFAVDFAVFSLNIAERQKIELRNTKLTLEQTNERARGAEGGTSTLPTPSSDAGPSRWRKIRSALTPSQPESSSALLVVFLAGTMVPCMVQIRRVCLLPCTMYVYHLLIHVFI